MSSAPQTSLEPSQLYLLALEKHWGIKKEALNDIGKTPNVLLLWQKDPDFRQREQGVLRQVNEKQKQIVLDSICSGTDLETASTRAHVTRTTVLNWRKADQEFDTAVLNAINNRQELASQVPEDGGFSRQQTAFLKAVFQCEGDFLRAAAISHVGIGQLEIWCDMQPAFKDGVNGIALAAMTGKVTESPPDVVGDFLEDHRHPLSAGEIERIKEQTGVNKTNSSDGAKRNSDLEGAFREALRSSRERNESRCRVSR